MIPADDWRDAAACRGHGEVMTARDLTDFTRKSRLARQRVAAAKAICAQCPVIDQCRAWVLGEDMDPCPWGVVAGMIPQERNANRRERGVNVAAQRGAANAARCGTTSGHKRHRRLMEPICPMCAAAWSAYVVDARRRRREAARLAVAS